MYRPEIYGRKFVPYKTDYKHIGCTMIIEDVDSLKIWLTRSLTPICDADPQALARYVVALVKKEKPDEDLRSTCLDQLEVFLQDKTKGFVELLFDALSNKKYLGDDKSTDANVESKEAKDSTTNSRREVRPPSKDIHVKETSNNVGHDAKRSRSRSRSPQRLHRPQSRSPESRRRYGDRPERRVADRLGPRRDSRPYRFGSGRYPPRRRSPRSRSPPPRAPRNYSLSPRSRDGSRSPFSSEEGRSPVRRSPDSRGSTPTEESQRERSKKQEAQTNLPAPSRPRCEDYDVRGFCLRGVTCPFDHGSDPVVVEDNKLPEVLAFPPNFSGPRGPVFNGPQAGAPLLAGRPGPHPPAIPGPVGHPPLPPNVLQPGPVIMQAGSQPAVSAEQFDAEQPQQLQQQPWMGKGFSQSNPGGRQFVNVPTGQSFQPRGSKRPYRGGGGYGGKRQFMAGRMGFGKTNNKRLENCTLEIRKIPFELNNIGKINEHFGKFGTLENIQIKYDGDAEAALVTFASNAEALAAYRCTDAVLNNRFIKVFWHKKEEPEARPPVKDRLGYVPTAIPKPAAGQEVSVDEHGMVTKTVQNTQAAAAGNPQREVKSPGQEASPQLPAALTKLIKSISTESDGAPAALEAGKPENVAPPRLTARQKRLQLQQQQHEVMVKKLEIQKQKQELLSKQLKNQKLLIEKLEKGKNLSADDKRDIMKTIKDLDVSVNSLKKQLVDNTKPVVKPAAKPKPSQPAAPAKSQEEAKKELLDAELEVIQKAASGEDTAALKRKVALLRQQAAVLGLTAAHAQPRSRTRSRGRVTTLDRRPKHLIVTGFDIADKEEVLEHFRILSDIVSEEADDSVPSVTLGFRSRNEAEKAVKGQRFRARMLKLQWYQPDTPPEPVRSLNRKRSVSAGEPAAAQALKEVGNGHSTSPPQPKVAKRRSSGVAEDSLLDAADEENVTLDHLDSEDVLLAVDEDEDEEESRPWRR